MKYEVHAALLRLFFAFISGGILGFERSAKGISAGFRTHIIVCMASCAIMLTNLYIHLAYHTGDPMRMPAQVISGVGFLGAGSILVTRHNRIKGVTTAAGLWAAACLGLCIGAGEYVISATVLVLECLTMTVFRIVDKSLVAKKKNIRVFAELESVSALSSFLRFLQEKDMTVSDLEFLDSKTGNSVAVDISLHLRERMPQRALIAELREAEGVVYLSEL